MNEQPIPYNNYVIKHKNKHSHTNKLFDIHDTETKLDTQGFLHQKNKIINFECRKD